MTAYRCGVILKIITFSVPIVSDVKLRIFWLNNSMDRVILMNGKSLTNGITLPRLFCFLLLTFVFMSPLLSASEEPKTAEYYVGITPTWVEIRSVEITSAVPETEISDGIYYRLLDKQVAVKENGDVTHYTRVIQTLMNQTALEKSSQINIDYDPSYQTLAIHSLNIIRNGQSIDYLSKTRGSLIQREKDLDKKIYDGRLTLNLIIEDIRKGDTLDYSFSIEGQNPVYNDIFAYQRSVSWSVPVNHQFVRVLWGKSSKLHINTRNITIKMDETRTGDYQQYQVYLFNQPTISYESDTPVWYDPYGMLYFSEIASWDKVVDWAIPMYKGVSDRHQSIVDIANEIKINTANLSEQIASALRYSQDEIRYLGIEMGANSHQPTPAYETVRLRYGDCKDKTVLFIALLAELGIEGFPVLVDTEYGKVLDDIPVNIHSFNHVIVTFEFNGQRFWLDPTLSLQKGKLTSLFQPDYGFGLIIQAGQNQLTSMYHKNTTSSFKIYENYKLKKETKEQVEFSVTTKYAGENAQIQLVKIERDGLKRLSEAFLQYYQRQYPQATRIDPLTMSLDESTGVLTLSERYLINDFWTKSADAYEADFYAYDIRNALYKPKIVNRNSPMSLYYPDHMTIQTSIEFEDKGWRFDNVDFIEDNDYFYFKASESFNNKSLVLSYDYYSKQDFIAKEDINKYLAAREKVRLNTDFGIMKPINAVQSGESDSSFDNKSILIAFCILMVIALIYMIVSWRLESRQRPDFSDSRFYPL